MRASGPRQERLTALPKALQKWEEGDVASVSARTRHVTPTKRSFAYKCAWTELGWDGKAIEDK